MNLASPDRDLIATLRQSLGEQRAEMLAQAGRSWLETRFTDDKRTFTLVRGPNGSLRVSRQEGYSKSTCGFGQWTEDDVARQVPRHLLALFTEFLRKPPEE